VLSPGETLIDRDLNTASLRRIMAFGNFLVASRFHAMIAGLGLGIPTLVLGWGHKYRELLTQFDCADMAIDFSEIEFAPLVERIDDLIARAEELSSKISGRQPEVLASSSRQFDWLTEFIQSRDNYCTDE
jgi:colanic acid/amylovoran biosynthesis protein